MQTQVFADFEAAMTLLTSEKSLVRGHGLTQVSGEGLTPIEYAVLSKNWQFLAFLVEKQVPVQIRPSSNLLCALGNLAQESASEFIQFIEMFLCPYLSSST